MEFLTDNRKNKIYLCVNYPFSNYEHVYYNNTGTETSFKEEGNTIYDAAAANVKKNIYNFVMKFNPGSAASIDNISAVDLTSGVLRLPLAYKQGINFNYMVIAPLNNSGYDREKIYYYCFIDAIEWSSNLKSAVIHFHVDSWNTYIHRVNMFESYIEREHVNDDTYGLHTIDEGLAPSNYKTVGSSRITPPGTTSEMEGAMIPVVAVGSNKHLFRDNPMNPDIAHPAFTMNPSDNYGYNPLLLSLSDITENNGFTIASEIAEITEWLVKANESDAILGCYLMPKALLHKPGNEQTGWTGTIYCVPDLEHPTMDYGVMQSYWAFRHTDTGSITKPTNPYSWTEGVKNQKTLTYPFCFVNISNQLGNELTLKYENSNNKGTISYDATCDANINGAMYLCAKDYNGISGVNLDYSLQSMNYPTLPLVIDSYDSYLAANRNTIANSKNYIENDYNFQKSQLTAQYDVNRAITSANDLFSGVRNLMGSGGASLGGTAANLLTNMAGSEVSHQLSMYNINASETLAQAANDYTAEKARDSIKASLADTANLPDKYCGRYIPNMLLCHDKWGFIYKKMCATPEELKSIDNYFTRYGYKVNTFAVPNLIHRLKFDYKKIIDINFTCEASAGSINTLKAIFNNGVTIWHTSNTAELFDYTINNSIVS